MTKVTIHRALSELKLIDARIQNQIQQIIPIGIHQKGKLVNNVEKEEDFKKSAESKFQSALDLITQKGKIKSAIVKANAETKVKIGDVEMTIADAINAKNSIGFKKQLIAQLNQHLQAATANLNRNNDIVNQNLQRLLEATFGKENVKAGVGDFDAVRNPFVAANEFHLFDPIKTKEKVESLTKEVESFEAEVDAVLSEINAITLVEY